ncbi:hypothetical protein RFI_22585 [Reticulomyxa filosa]|uniref:Kelch motif family protein n=1 Tax=Reticulomyxa filosa TaxID=46433 RepID=X6MMW9_RETFI|nr:hypothetical protein RFI_22585 [Reticulomyxa filosa]|eukprot:ETO14782.1 hypothetical protein RFI_22585 [Reticulomyxa filosa]
MFDQGFQNLNDLPNQLFQSQCVQHRHEILICGGSQNKCCYSYHTLKNKYKLICLYPSNVNLCGHCVVKLEDNNNKDSNEITLLSFGGNYSKHTLVMRYVSVWNDNNEANQSKKLNNCNQWVPFTDNNNRIIRIGRDGDNYWGARAVIGGSNNHLLFVTYYQRDISVFNLNTFQFIKHGTLPVGHIGFHCFVSRLENGREILKKNKNKNHEMLLFKDNARLSIEYNEDNNTFQFHKLPVCKDIASLKEYACVCINDTILFFGGKNYKKDSVSNSLHKYSIKEKTWTIFKHALLIPLYNHFVILNEDKTYIHIIGGIDDKMRILSTHMKIRANDALHLPKNEIKVVIHHWLRILKIRLGWIDDFNKIIIKYVNKYFFFFFFYI